MTLSKSYIIIVVAYLLALMQAMFVYFFLTFYFPDINELVAMLIADVVATIVVFVFSLAYGNSSVYDPYWSVVPPFIAFAWFGGILDSYLLGYLLLFAISFWAIRLTINWVKGWQGLVHEDWRYIMLRKKNPSLYWLTNFGGIHLFPTLMVYLGMVPVYFAMINAERNLSMPILLLGFNITIAATLIEYFADEQMRTFKKTAKPSSFIQSGLWKYSRHPNYFGEILFWFGLWVILMAVAPEYWYTAMGFLAMLAMFLFVSIPMMEEKNKNSKPGFDTYTRTVSVLVPLPNKKLN